MSEPTRVADAAVRGIGRNLLVYGLSAAVPGLAGLAAAPIFTRLLPKTDYSQYVLALAVIAAASALNSSVSMSVLRFFPIAEKVGRGREFFHRGILLALLSGAVIALAVAVAGAIGGHRVGPGFGRLLIIAAVVFLFTELANVLLSFARISGRGVAYLSFRAWQAAGALLAGVFAIAVFRMGPAGALVGTGIALAIGIPLLWRTVTNGTSMLRQAVPAHPAGVDTGIRGIAAYGVPLMVAELAAWGLRLSDRWMLQAFAGADSVAVYAAAYTISEATILMVIAVFQLALRPIEVRVWEDAGVSGAERFATASTRIFLLMSLPVAALAWALARPLFMFALPPSYLPGAQLVPWVVCSGILLGLQHRYQAGIVAARKTARISYAAAAGLAVNLGLNFWLLPRYGMFGAAVTTLTGYLVFCLGVAVGARDLLKWRFPLRAFGVALLGAAFAFGIARIVSNRSQSLPPLCVLVLAGVAGLGVYAVVLILFGEVDPAAVRHVFSRAGRPVAPIRGGS